MFGNRESGKDGRPKRSHTPHEEFLELCALSTTGVLSEGERKRLREHLAECSECRQALVEFEAAANVGAPLVAAELATSETSAEVLPLADLCGSRSPGETNPLTEDADGKIGEKGFLLARGNGYHSSQLNWNYLWMPFAATVALIIAFGIYTYQTGRRRGVEVAKTMPNAGDRRVELDALEQRLSDTGHEREVVQAQLTERDRVIRQLQLDIQTESSELAGVRESEEKLERSLEASRTENTQIAQERSSLDQLLETTKLSLKKTQGQLDSLQRARDEEDVRVQSLSDQIKDLYGQLGDREHTINQQQEMLADDRDIRDLMGARNLYIAEVYDVARDGTTRKPYGRVFYTKGKSLVFYAYDLDEQPGVRKTSTFQAWGQNGPDRERTLNLGIFYQDNAAQKRWVLKFDDARKLDQINAVFVTVEPHGGSEEPSGQRLLFASLKIEPNHP